MEEVKLHGAWVSSYSFRVIWALKLKGIPFEYIEEDFLKNKSNLLLALNPLHKKIPVLVHDGRPICESMIIIEYIEEIWPQNPLCPNDPYERALARFWVKFAEDKGPIIWAIFKTKGEEQEKAKKECLEMLKEIEEKAFGDKMLFGGEKIGIVDIAFGGYFVHWFQVIEEIVGVILLEAKSFPHLNAWINNFKEVPVIKQNLPNRENMLVFYKSIKEKLLAYTN